MCEIERKKEEEKWEKLLSKVLPSVFRNYSGKSGNSKVIPHLNKNQIVSLLLGALCNIS